MADLQDLPQFTITAISSSDGESTQLEGTFNILSDVNLDGWDYLYRYGVRSWLPAEVISCNELRKSMIYSVYTKHLAPFHAKIGDVLAWIDSSWRPEYVEAILDSEKKWMKQVGPVGIRTQCEKCMICENYIEAQASYWWSAAYESTHAFFACEKCYRKFVMPKDLAFML